MAINFPDNPQDGTTHTHTDGKTWTYNDGSWSSAGSGGGGSSSSITDGTSTLSFDTNNNISIDTHIIPESNADYDLGNAEYKIRHLFLSDNSLKFGKDGTSDISGETVSFGRDNLDRNAEVYTDQDAGVIAPTPYSIGKKGDIRIIANFMYVCIRTIETEDGNVSWIRVSLEQSW